MAARDLGLTSRSGEDDGDLFEARDFEAFAGEGWGEAEAERFVRDLVLGPGEAEAPCADLRLLGLLGDMDGDFLSPRFLSRESSRGEAERFRSRASSRGEFDLDRFLPSPFPRIASLRGDLTGDSRVSRVFFLADDGSGEADEEDDRLS